MLLFPHPKICNETQEAAAVLGKFHDITPLAESRTLLDEISVS